MSVEIVDIERNDGITLVALSGRLDVAGTQAVDAKLHAYATSRRQPAILDMSAVTFVSSLGIGTLVSCAKALDRRGLPTVILTPPGLVADALRTVGIDRAIPIVGSLDEAEETLRS